MKNYKVIKAEYRYVGRGMKIEMINVECLKCSKTFYMDRKFNYCDDNIKESIEYTYCPHCANKLDVK